MMGCRTLVLAGCGLGVRRECTVPIRPQVTTSSSWYTEYSIVCPATVSPPVLYCIRLFSIHYMSRLFVRGLVRKKFMTPERWDPQES